MGGGGGRGASPGLRLLSGALAISLVASLAALASVRLLHLSGYERPAPMVLARSLQKLARNDATMVDSWGPMLRALAIVHTPATHDRLYETLFFADRIKFQYPPTSLLWLEPFRHPRPDRARLALNTLNLVATGACALFTALLARRVLDRGGRVAAAHAARSWAVPVTAFLLAGPLFYPLMRGLLFGQIQVWIDALVAGACMAWIAERRAVAGALIALGCTIKPQLGLVAVWALVAGEWRCLAGFVAVGVPALLASLAAYGLHNHLEYREVASYMAARGESYLPNNSVNGVLNRWFGNGGLGFDAHAYPPPDRWVQAGTLASTALLVALPILNAVTRRGARGGLAFGAAVLCATLASPIVWQHHYGVTAPLLLLLAGEALRETSPRRRRAVLAGLALAWLLMATPFSALDRLGPTPFSPLTAQFFWAACLMLLIFELLCWRRQPAPPGALPPADEPWRASIPAPT